MVTEMSLPAVNQTLEVNIDELQYQLKLTMRGEFMYLDILKIDSSPVILGIRLVEGTNLLDQHQHLIKTSLVVQFQNDTIPSTIKMYFYQKE